MLKHLRALRQRMLDRRRYEALIADLERINAADMTEMDRAGAAAPLQQHAGR